MTSCSKSGRTSVFRTQYDDVSHLTCYQHGVPRQLKFMTLAVPASANAKEQVKDSGRALARNVASRIGCRDKGGNRRYAKRGLQHLVVAIKLERWKPTASSSCEFCAMRPVHVRTLRVLQKKKRESNLMWKRHVLYEGVWNPREVKLSLVLSSVEHSHKNHCLGNDVRLKTDNSISILMWHAPSQRRQPRRRQPSWWTPACMAACVARTGAWRDNPRSQSPDDHARFSAARMAFHRVCGLPSRPPPIPQPLLPDPDVVPGHAGHSHSKKGRRRQHDPRGQSSTTPKRDGTAARPQRGERGKQHQPKGGGGDHHCISVILLCATFRYFASLHFNLISLSFMSLKQFQLLTLILSRKKRNGSTTPAHT